MAWSHPSKKTLMMIDDSVNGYFATPAAVEPLVGKRVLVTGATAGIGLATACLLARRGAHLVLSGRREERLTRLKSLLAEHAPGVLVETIPADVTSSDDRARLPDDVDILVNSAGLALGREHGAVARTEDWDIMIATNLVALAHLVRRTLPYMVERKQGHVVSLCSVAAHQSYAGGSMYCATKAAVRSLHQCFRQEVHGHGVRLTLVSPGMVETEFSLVRFGGDAKAAEAVYAGMTPLTAGDVAAQIVHALGQPAHVNIDEIVIMPTAQGAATVVHRR